MSTNTEKTLGSKPSKTETSFVCHDSKRLRLRAMSTEKDTFSKYLSKPLAKKISWTQLILAVIICSMQIIAMSLVAGRYSYYDSMAGMGGGIWSSVLIAATAILTIWSLKNSKYWKLHLSFALHIVSMLAALVILITEFGGNIPSYKYRTGEALYGNDDGNLVNNKGNKDKELQLGSFKNGSHTPRGWTFYVSISMLIIGLVLNTLMATGTLAQLVLSFVMTLMTGRAICCGHSGAHGKLFELEIAGNETADGVAIVQNNLTGIGLHAPGGITTTTGAPPPPYMESIIESA